MGRMMLGGAVVVLLGVAATIQALPGDSGVVAVGSAGIDLEASAAPDPSASQPPPPTPEQLDRAEFLNAAAHLGPDFEVSDRPPFRISLPPDSPTAADLPGDYRVVVEREVIEGVPPYSQLRQNSALLAMCAPRVEAGVEYLPCTEAWGGQGPDTDVDGIPTRSGPLVVVQPMRGISANHPSAGLRVYLVQPRNLSDARIIGWTMWATAAKAGEMPSARPWVDARTERMIAALLGQPASTWSPSDG